MKKLTKALLMLAVAVTVIFASASIASAASLPATQVSCTDNTITISTGTFSPNVTYYNIYNISTGTYIDTNIPSYETEITLNAEPGTVAYIRIEGYQPDKNYYSDSASIYVNTLPEKYKTSEFGIDYISSYSKYVSFKIPRSNNTGAIINIKKYNGGSNVDTLTFTGSYSGNESISANVPYKYRAKLYYTNTSNTTTYEGKYSSYKYFMLVDAKYGNNSSKNGINLKVKGVKNVKYKVYVATSNNGTYKYTTTLKPTSGKWKTYLISKRGDSSMKKGQTYYFKVVPYIGDHKSESYADFSCTNYIY